MNKYGKVARTRCPEFAELECVFVKIILMSVCTQSISRSEVKLMNFIKSLF